MTPPSQSEGAASGSDLERAPYPGSKRMPRWGLDELSEPPKIGFKNFLGMMGPGLLMGVAAIGGGEWLLGPVLSAKYGGALLWVATVSILLQVVFNVECSRYALYTGEPIMSGMMRTFLGPVFWISFYLLFDFGSFFQFKVASAVAPVIALATGEMPDPGDTGLLTTMSYVIWILLLIPLFIGGKIYRTLKILMTVKLVVVLGVLGSIAVFYSSWSTWSEILLGFLQFGNIPLRDGESVNVFVNLFQGVSLPPIELETVGLLTAFAAIAGWGGLGQMAVSNYTRDEGWGMGSKVGAIPSMIGGGDVKLSHVGCVFRVTSQSLQYWKGWLKRVRFDQYCLYVPTAMVGIALPSMLAIEFLSGVEVASNDWLIAGMTAEAVRDAIGGWMGIFFWYMLMVCGFLILVPSTTVGVDSTVRRWVDTFWTAIPGLRKWNPSEVKKVYFYILLFKALMTMVGLSFGSPVALLLIFGTLSNFALGFVSFHTLYVNLTLLPDELKPCWLQRIGVCVCGVFYLFLGGLMTWIKFA
jgi:Mn2+/Fe2+ NRAMP family transporter